MSFTKVKIIKHIYLFTSFLTVRSSGLSGLSAKTDQTSESCPVANPPPPGNHSCPNQEEEEENEDDEGGPSTSLHHVVESYKYMIDIMF